MRKPFRAASQPGNKVCPRCDQEKPLAEFSRSYCKPCRRVLSKQHQLRQASETDEQAKARFWKRVKKGGAGECWLWQGKPKADGYGQFWMRGRVWYAHRAALELLGVVIPEGMDADHMCRVRLCVSPYHLRAVTERENCLENNDSPFAKNARKTHCSKGHPLSGGNIALMPGVGPKGSRTVSRMCLTCWPSYRNNPKRLNKHSDQIL